MFARLNRINRFVVALDCRTLSHTMSSTWSVVRFFMLPVHVYCMNELACLFALCAPLQKIEIEND